MTLTVRTHADDASLAGDVASALLARLEEVQSGGEVAHVGLTGGSIADAVHRELARRAAECGVDWSRVVFWWGDERFVAGDSPDRNAVQAQDALLGLLADLGLPPDNVHEIPSSDEVTTAEEAATAYAAALGTDGPSHFDVLMLGIGPDGHIASLFPGHPALDVRDAAAVAVHDSPKPPPDRVSLTFATLARSRAVWFIVSGAEKARAVASVLSLEDREPTTEEVREVPARGVRGQSETVWWLDEAATP